MTARIEIAIAALFLAVGVAGPPLEPLRILGAAAICAAIPISGKYDAAIALVAVVAAGWLQHGEIRLAVLAAAAALGLTVMITRRRPRAASAIAAVSAIAGLLFLFLS
jgi:hypothetical protein